MRWFVDRIVDQIIFQVIKFDQMIYSFDETESQQLTRNHYIDLSTLCEVIHFSSLIH